MNTYTITLQVGKSVAVSLAPRDPLENPGSVVNIPDLSTSNGTVAVFSHAAVDHMSFEIDGKAVGTATLLADCQATPFPENLRAKTQFLVTVTGGPADHFQATISAPHDTLA